MTKRRVIHPVCLPTHIPIDEVFIYIVLGAIWTQITAGWLAWIGATAIGFFGLSRLVTALFKAGGEDAVNVFEENDRRAMP